MIFTKITTSLLGIALLIPVAASFWIMAAYKPKSQAELQKSLDDALATAKTDIDAQVTQGSPQAMGAIVQVTSQIGLPFISPRLWSAFPRRWVGIVGLFCTVIIAGLWIYSSFIPSDMMTGEYGRDGDLYPDPAASPPDTGHANFHNEPSTESSTWQNGAPKRNN